MQKTWNFSGTGRSTNSIAWKRWLFWNKWILQWLKKRRIKIRWWGCVNFHCMQMRLVMILRSIFGYNWNDALLIKLWSRFAEKRFFLLGCPSQDTPSYNFGFSVICTEKRSPGGGKARGFSTQKRCSHKWFHTIFPYTDLPRIFFVPRLRPPDTQKALRIKKAICVVRSDSRRFDYSSHFL